MKNIPVFTTENGAASLIVKEIPYSKTAYIQIQDTLEPEKLLAECVDFCRAVGAEQIFAANHPYLARYPFHTAIWQMVRSRQGLAETDAALFPVTEKTLEIWRGVYNQRMAKVPNFSYMAAADAGQMLQRGDGYFVHRGEVLLGIGMASGACINAVVSVQPGAGQEVVLTLNHALSGEQILLEVASTNEKAVRLYQRLGFLKTAEKSIWYRVFSADM